MPLDVPVDSRASLVIPGLTGLLPRFLYVFQLTWFFHFLVGLSVLVLPIGFFPADAFQVLLTDVRCTELDTDVRRCRSEPVDHVENECGHERDVGLRCQRLSWAGLRFGITAKKSLLRHVTVEKVTP